MYLGCVNYGDLDGQERYGCDLCDFDICVKCYERAEVALRNYQQVSDVLNKDTKLKWMRCKLPILFPQVLT